MSEVLLQTKSINISVRREMTTEANGFVFDHLPGFTFNNSRIARRNDEHKADDFKTLFILFSF